MKKRKIQLRIEKTTISRLANLNVIKGGEIIGSLGCQGISRWPIICVPPPTENTKNGC